MSRLILLLLVCSSCDTRVVELWPDTGIGIVDTGIVDTGVPPDAFVDAGDSDSGAPDSGDRDVGFPDATEPDSGVDCVCRYASCRDNPTCETEHFRGSTCEAGAVCSGSVGPCQTVRDCSGGAAGWICALDETSTDPCP